MADKDSVQIKKQLSEKLPEYKFSVTRNDFAGGHSVNVRVLSGPFQVFANDNARDSQNGYIEIWRDKYKEDDRINDAIKPDIDKMYKIIYDIGQFPSGYHGGPYLHWNFGSYSKPYEVTASKKSTPAPQKSSGQTNADSELLMSFSQGWNLYKTTINKTGTDGNPLTLVVYNLNKTKELKNIPYEKFKEFKGEMLVNLKMKWVNGFAKFEKWTFPPDTDVLKVIVDKYYGVGESKKEETPTPQPTPKSSKMSVKEIADRLMTFNETQWDRLGINSGSQLYSDDELQKKYIKILSDHYESDTAIPTKLKELKMSERDELYGIIEDENQNSLLNFLELYGYFGVIPKTRAEESFEKNGKSFSLNPKNFKPEEEKLSFKVGDKILVVENNKIFTIKSIGEGGTTNVVYEDGTPAAFFPRQITNGLKNGSYKFVIEKTEDKLKEGDVYYSKLFEQKLTIAKVQDDTIFVDYEDDSSERYTPQYCRLMIARGDWIKVVDEEKEELPFKVGDIYKDAYSKKDLQIVKIEGNTIFFTLNGTEYNVGVIIAESYLVNKIWTKQEPKQGNEEEIKKAIAALEILAEDGDEDAKKGIKALKILLN
jgi:hypothetical protein